MAERLRGEGVHALVDDDGQWYDQGVRVHIERTRSGQSGYRLVLDGNGDRQVVGCRRTMFKGWPMLVVSLQRTRG